MSDTPDMPGDGPEMTGPELTGDDALAAEYALGVLSAAERAAAETRATRDPAFAAAVEAWRARLEPLSDEIVPVAVSEGLWRAVERSLPSNDDAALLRRRASAWRNAAVAGFGLAAASLAAVGVMVARPPQVIQAPAAAPAPMLNATLATQGGQQLFVAAYDPERQALIITSLVPAGADPGHVHQLWLIPADGKPRSLGMVTPGKSSEMPMAKDMAPMVGEGATLAVSVEPPGGSPMPHPTGPVAATGALAKI